MGAAFLPWPWQSVPETDEVRNDDGIWQGWQSSTRTRSVQHSTTVSHKEEGRCERTDGYDDNDDDYDGYGRSDLSLLSC